MTALSVASFALDGLLPDRILEPGSTDAVREAVAEARASGAGIVPWGGGTDAHRGNVPTRYDIALSLGRLDRIGPEYSPADLVVTVGPGTRFERLQAFLREHGQRLPLEAPPGATLGGIVAAATSGKRRLCRGTPRDWLVGLQLVSGAGKLIRAGGKVVKNVTGYDLCKLLCGSRGTLGILVELSFKVAPLPETARRGTVTCPGLAEAEAVRHAAMEAHAAWIELEFDGGGLAGNGGAGSVRVEIGFEGFGADVEAQIGRVSAALRRECLDLPDWQLDDAPPPHPPGDARPSHLPDAPLVFRLATLPDRLAEVLGQGPGLERASVRAHLGNGLARVALDIPDPRETFLAWRSLAARAGGHAVLERGPKDALDVFGEPQPALVIARGLKQVFDPDGVMSPGRGPGRF